jgi:hypothetical protein
MTAPQAGAPTPRQAGLRVAVLTALYDTVGKDLKKARAEAEAVFAGARADGQSQQKALLPDDAEIGLFSIKAGVKSLADEPGREEKLAAWVRASDPSGIEPYLDPKAVTDLEVIEIIGALFPDLVKTRIRASVREALVEQLLATGGYAVNADGEKEKLAEIIDGKPTGAFAYRAAPGAAERVAAAWRAGELGDIPLGPLSLPAGTGAAA